MAEISTMLFLLGDVGGVASWVHTGWSAFLFGFGRAVSESLLDMSMQIRCKTLGEVKDVTSRGKKDNRTEEFLGE